MALSSDERSLLAFDAAFARVEATPCSLVLPDDFPFEQWEQLYRGVNNLVETKRAELWTAMWWLADLLHFGEYHYGEKYASVSSATGYAPQTLANLCWLGGVFESSRRREGLSPAHHAAVAGLPVADQDALLDRAVRERLSERSLRDEAHDLRALNSGNDPDRERVERALARAVETVMVLPVEEWATAAVAFVTGFRLHMGDEAYCEFMRSVTERLQDCLEATSEGER